MDYYLPPAVALTGFSRTWCREGRGNSGSAVTASLRRRWPSIRVAAFSPDAGFVRDGAPDTSTPERPDARFHLPDATDAGSFLRHLDEARAAVPFEAIVPLLDTEVGVLYELREELRDRGVLVLLPERHAYERSRPEALPDLAREAGVPMPETFVARTGAEEADAVFWAGAHLARRSGALFVKRPFERAVRVAHVETARVAIRAAFARGNGQGPVLVQEALEGIETVGVLAVGNGKGGLFASGTIRKPFLSPLGRFRPGVTLNDPGLNRTVAALLRTLRWNGPIEIEFLRDLRGTFHLLAIHPCFPGWAYLPSLFGCNLTALALYHLTQSQGGREVVIPPQPALPHGRMVPLCPEKEEVRLPAPAPVPIFMEGEEPCLF